MKKLKNPTITATHHFPMINTFTKEILSEDGQNANVIIESGNLRNDILIQINIVDGKIKTNVSTNY